MILLIHPGEKEYVSVTEAEREREIELFMVSKQIQRLEQGSATLLYSSAAAPCGSGK